MYAKTRKVLAIGGSQCVALPPGTPVAEWASVAADRLVWIDPEGEVSPAELLKIVREFERPILKRLDEAKRRTTRETGA